MYVLGFGICRATNVTRDRCYDFKNIFAEKFSKNIGVFCSNLLLVFAKIVIITFVFEKKTPIFSPKIGKIAENCDHNIDPSLDEILPFGLFLLPWAHLFAQ
jgi:hypothetical protein